MWKPIALIAINLVFIGSTARAATIDFEGFDDGTVLTNQYSGVSFANAQIAGAGLSLNELEFPPFSGANVAIDNGGPLSLTFASPITSFSAHLTYSATISLQVFDASSHLLGSVTSAFSNNEALSGVPGSQHNELLQVTANGITMVTITAGATDPSFAVDDISYDAAAVPEPSTLFLLLFGCAAIAVISAVRTLRTCLSSGACPRSPF